MDIAFDKVEWRRPDFQLAADLAIPSGAAVALIGPSGSGKSTLLNLIAGFEAPTGGRVLMGGVDQAGTGPADRPVTMVFQDHNLFPHMTVERNVGLGLDPGLRLDAAQRARRDLVLAEVGLAGLGQRRPAELSGGQQSRVALARALLRDRPVLLLDEPFAALGPAMRAEMLGLVGRLHRDRGMTVVMVSHDPADAARLCDLAILVADGVARPPRPTQALLDDPPPALRAYLGEGPETKRADPKARP